MESATRSRRAPRPPRVSGDERERTILATAEQLLDEKTFAEITIDDLARGAGLSRPTFYFYFASKQAVLLALLDQVAHEAERRSAHVFDDLARDPAGSWRRAIEAFADTFATHRGVSVAASAARATEPELAAQWTTLTRGWIAATASAIAAERERGASPSGPSPESLATALNLLNERMIVASLTEPGLPGAREATVETLLHVWLSSIYGSAPSPEPAFRHSISKERSCSQDDSTSPPPRSPSRRCRPRRPGRGRSASRSEPRACASPTCISSRGC
ncbi:hypothetical protein GCM10025867_11510 [Frondihabitans sucicola]|uniref:HTH tetR-type domain-containing protein n=1 Tax=Frondihabitans sucicola TaxID=1268041 RepID=A0ABN6XV62_9MICO|nr:TetR/AcrR family transcriptional regulator [Frondihabitans sucicola]BDZ48910.1 hypothetical protein GCM10025867_11510 [Frondihabitans sucicola]